MAAPLLLNAQRQKQGNLTIFSEDGDKFFLILNGEKQNNVAQTNLRVEELPQPYYNARIIFEDSTIAPVSKNNLMIADVDGVMKDVTYKIKKDKARKAKLNYFSAIDVQEDYIPPSNVYVYHFGNPLEVHHNGAVTTTTTTTTNGVSANVSVPGVSMNVNITDPVYTESTTTTTTTSSNSSNTGSNNNTHSSGSGCNGWPMNSTDFAAALKTIGNGSFEETKLTTAKSISSQNCLSSDQVVKICNLFSFEESKLVFAKHAYKRTTDKKNFFKVNDVFSFDSSKEELSKFIGDED